MRKRKGFSLRERVWSEVEQPSSTSTSPRSQCHQSHTSQLLSPQSQAIVAATISEREEVQTMRDGANLSGKEAIMELIESKTDSAAAVVCRLFREIPLRGQQNNFIAKILGIVAFLGTVKTKELSRILTEYLGEDLMLAIVCKSYASAHALEKYERSGNVNHACALHAIATKQGQSIKGRYLVICLEDIRPYTGELGDDPERKLALPDPTLPNGNTPSGYLGYAVNMVGLDARHLHIRTNTGHGLRETLFYCLFGNLQVYETRENMKMAKACIKHGAVSLDGGIMKGNGVLSLGHWESEICFPVIVPGTQTHFSQQSPEIVKQIEETKFELKEVNDEIEKDTKIVEKVLKKFKKTKERYVEFLDKKVPLLSKLDASLC
ncbi:hypothetical protein TEA_027990 [Camellia sinensis var. sinensis]|uniref:Protein DEFECTIVE IN MERISTEM SILENCING 3 n=1 Tax=Camellia sinensis var. sinensis TaxID=542762 RepID=A0A4S4E4B7_CAMSN|nr:hypothetical protein TEA_027990 [Camellia sinensis var. sinensis]